MKAIRFTQTGAPEVLNLVDVECPVPGPTELRIEHQAIGVNFIDTYHRSGAYPLQTPSGLGMEAAGVVDGVGREVTGFCVGDRVGYCTGPIGAYAERHVIGADRAIKLPSAISDRDAASVMLKGLTARFLVKQTCPLRVGDVCVVHAAAGGVGQLLAQWARELGAIVIAVVGDARKAALVRTLGADHVLISGENDIAARVRDLTNGIGAHVVYDSVGRDTFQASLDSLRPRGMLVSFGNTSGPPPDVNLGALAQKGSLFFTRPSLFDHVRTRHLLQEGADEVFAAIARGAIAVAPPAEYRLADAARAHIDLEMRRTVGSVVLIP